MIVAGIDSAALTGIAILDGGRLVRHAAVTIGGCHELGWKGIGLIERGTKI
jgi:hypothetical protein